MRNAYMLGVTHGRSKPITQTLGNPDSFGRRGLALRLKADARTLRQASCRSQRRTLRVRRLAPL
jgi:hypothetical protein